jgi:hypothetical protein
VSVDRAGVVKTNYFASYAFIDLLAGYHWFKTGEDACLKSQTFTCVDEKKCNVMAPYTTENEDGSAWKTSG